MSDLYGRPIFGQPIRCYRCVRCQTEHREDLDEKYADHLMCQSKHGVYERTPTAEEVVELERIAHRILVRMAND